MKTNAIILPVVWMILLILGGPLPSDAFKPYDSAPEVDVLINGKRMNMKSDSLLFSAKGILTIQSIQAPQVGLTQFKVMIRHRNNVGKLRFFAWDEEYDSGKAMEQLDLQTLMSKVHPGEEVVIIPVVHGTKLQAGRPIIVQVSKDGC